MDEKRRSLGRIGFSLVLIAICVLHAAPLFPDRTEDARWNVLLVSIDTIRADRLGSYGNPDALTPTLDALAERGVVFRRAFANATTTLPSHANIMTGVTPLYHGIHDNGTFRLENTFMTLAEILKEQGYSTGAFIGAYPLDSRFGLDQGFDVYDDDYSSAEKERLAYVERPAGEVVDSALAWLADQKSSPWFGWIHCYDPHDPYRPPDPFRSRFASAPYDGEVAYVDSVLKRLTDWLEAGNLYSRTLVIVTGDHGEGLGDHGESTHGYFAYNSTLWIPLIVAAPGIEPGSVEEAVSHVDLLPSVCEALDIKIPKHIQGRSLWKAVRGRKLKAAPIYFESLYPYYSRGWAPLRGLIEDGGKYISSPIPELYDLAEDFEETRNLAQSKDRDRFEGRLQRYIRQASLSEDRKPKPRIDPESVAKLRSLGYVSSQPGSRKTSFGPSDDIKTLMPYHTRSVSAMDLAKEGQKAEAIERLKEVLTDRPDMDVAYTNLAFLYSETGRRADGIEVLRLGREKLPESYEIFSAYINALLNARLYGEVVGAFRAASLRQMDHDPEIWNYLGVAHMSLGEFEKAVTALEQSLNLDGNYPVALSNLGMTYFSWFLQSKEPEKLSQAETAFHKAVSLDGDYATPYNGLGLTARSGGRLAEAVEHFLQALELNPGFGNALYNLGITYLDLGQKTRALESFMKYKNEYHSHLTERSRQRLEELIAQCKKRP